ncbi:MAG: glycosyltransferase [Solirubrobacteraceae bacterium]
MRSQPMPIQLSQRVALVHDFLLDLRGAERVFLELCAMWPDADIFTSVYDEHGTEGRFSHRNVNASFLQKLRPTARTFRALLPLYPAAVESLELSSYDLVLSSSSAWAHAVLCGEHSTHVSYCHNPFRYVWNDRDQTLAHRNPLARRLLRHLFHRWRQWDWIAAQRTDRYIANARTTQQRIRAYYGRDAEIVHPPVQIERFKPGPVGDHYAVVGELMAHKQIDVAVAAFNKLRRPLVIVGDGPDYRRLRGLAGSTISFTGRVPDAQVAQVYSSARALVVSAVEEFGITAVECQAAGRPVIARGEGGALETVIGGVTGCFWTGGAERLVEAVRRFDQAAIEPDACVRNAARFAPASFRAGVSAQVRAALSRNGTVPRKLCEPCSAAPRVRRAARASEG